ncbi:hypothetical protein OG875_04680 [Streptomyces sp. NBC_01498]|uniref:hypothetical protein n=1 Tax=Streptomyces sp. NBC_01498 TaxID=2975870 RepID=UPI002E7BF38E|nr:hypothetical protein [Streptomyces sp. NBC_01498]WTL23951.1 hypothetical protein OG875_04680 [Streptomyces sp. NBC_01498]
MTSSADLAAALKRRTVRAVEGTPSARGGDWRTAIVAAVTAGGTVATDDGIVVRQLESYRNPIIGDTIVIARSGSGNWVAHGRLATSTDVPWAAYTCAWTAATTNPVIGNGTRTARVSLNGKSATVAVRIAPGSTTTFGSGNYSFSLPYPSAADVVEYTGAARLTAGSTYIGQTYATAGASTFTATFPTAATPANATNMSPTTPATLANGHILRMSLTYQIA